MGFQRGEGFRCGFRERRFRMVQGGSEVQWFRGFTAQFEGLLGGPTRISACLDIRISAFLDTRISAFRDAQTSCLSSLPLPASPFSRCTFWHSFFFYPLVTLQAVLLHCQPQLGVPQTPNVRACLRRVAATRCLQSLGARHQCLHLMHRVAACFAQGTARRTRVSRPKCERR